ncbi:putative transmembrane protein [Cucumis melo var. makuwa]|uniref:Transmembrane protein n=1 Tax=Cucumis melo var. makuwa TaxID=1194695 RepID=A0A5A7SVZ8_CUCMM|nr:putative transmembrane protein [Cucumis melo var. makuwa]
MKRNNKIFIDMRIVEWGGTLAPPVIVFSSACAGMTGGAVPALAQLVASSYHSLASSSKDDKSQDSRSSSTL